MIIEPEWSSTILSRVEIKEDLPAAVLPTMPTWVRSREEARFSLQDEVHLGAAHNVHTDVLQDEGKVRTILEVDGRHQNSTLCCKDFAIALRGFETIARNLFPMK